MMYINPMLAVNANPHSRPDWSYELKLDGQRCLGVLEGTQTTLQARSGRLITACYPEISIQAMHNLVVDGEMICELPNGLPDFPMIQRRMKQSKSLLINHLAKTHPAKYWVFDVLYVDGVSVMSRPLLERKAILKAELIPNDRVRVLPWSIGNGKELFEKACGAGYEGVMGKCSTSWYSEGDRSSSWQKMKPLKSGQFFAVGLTVSDNREFKSIILARMVGNEFQYVSTVSSGLTDKDVQKWFVKPAVSLSLKVPVDVKVLKWIEPQAIKVFYYEQTVEGHLRFPRLVPSRPRFGI